MTSLTHLQKTNRDGFPKAGELIEITGCHELEASDRAILNILYQHAHDSGKLGQAGMEWEVPLTNLRFSACHKGAERLSDIMDRLMRIVVTVSYLERGEERLLKTPLLDFVVLASGEGGRSANCRFGIPATLLPILLQSAHWERINAEAGGGAKRGIVTHTSPLPDV